MSKEYHATCVVALKAGWICKFKICIFCCLSDCRNSRKGLVIHTGNKVLNAGIGDYVVRKKVF